MATYYAHTKDTDKNNWQPLIDHLTQTARLASEFGGDAGVSDLARIAGLMHDIGKYSPAFQQRLEGAKNPVDHAIAGAKELLSLFQEPPQAIYAQLLAYCIAGHHTGLPDIGSIIDPGEAGTLRARLNRVNQNNKANLDYAAYKTEIDLSGLALENRKLIHPLKKHIQFSVAFLIRMIYSALVDADFQDTETFARGEKPRGGYMSIGVLCEQCNRYLQKFDLPQNPIDQKRTETLNACIKNSSLKPGFFTLTIPTGGGKTLASMAFALNHAARHGLKRVIYVIPFTSIIEQNAGVFKEFLGSDTVLEHHSNFDWDRAFPINHTSTHDEVFDAPTILRLAAENWDIPIVVTTNVQFFESLFANRSSRCRKLHNIAKSVLIFDEAQMLPREYLGPSLSAVWELVTNYGCSAVFCTATQPALGKILPEGTQTTELAPDPSTLYEFYRRVQVTDLGVLTDRELIGRINVHPQALCIVNTRKHARGLFEMIAGEGSYHLSTLMCPANRKEKLLEIRERLKNGQPCRVISTQVMEAGIDVDFPVGYRALAGLDSIIQAAGRVNRERKQPSGNVYVFEPDSEFVKRAPLFIEQGAAVARSILRDYKDDPVSIKAINAYFETILSLHGDRHDLDAKGIFACFDKAEGFDFNTAAERFRIIESPTVPVIIPYNQDAERLLDELRYTPYPSSTLRKLQVYTVNIYEHEFQALNSKGAIGIVADEYNYLLAPEYYDSKTGMIIPDDSGGNALFC